MIANFITAGKKGLVQINLPFKPKTKRSKFPILLLLCTIFLITISAKGYSHFEKADSLSFLISDTIFIASEPDYPPYCFVDKNGLPDGFAVELFKASAEAAGLKSNIKIGLWNIIKQELADGEIDALPLVGRTPEREKIFDFTFPYLSLHGAVFVRREDRIINSIEDLKEKEILVMRGDNAEEFLRRNKISDKIITTNTFEEAFIKLANGEGDAILTQRVIGLNLIKDLKLKNIVASKLHVPEFRQDFCFAVKKGNLRLLSRINEGLSIVIANKTYNEIHTKWFGPALNEKITKKDIARIALFIFIPLLIIMAIFLIFFLRREVRRQTKQLNQEIIERKQIETKAIEERNKAQQYLDIAGVMLLSLDKNGCVQLVNPKGCEMLGYSKEEIMGKNWSDMFLPEDVKKTVLEVESKVLSGEMGHVAYFENTVKTKSGEERLIAWKNAVLKNENGQIIGSLSSGEDITDRKKNEIELLKAKEKAEESENFLTNIVDGIGDPVFVKDNKRRFIIANAAFCATLGRRRKDIIGKILAKDVPPEEQEIFTKTDNQVLNDGIENINEETLTVRGGETITISTRKTRYIDDRGNKFLIGVIRDISNRIEQEKELLKAKERAEESDQLKTAFLQNLSHEIRTPMNSIMGFASLLPDEEDKTLINNYSNIIVKNSEQLVIVIDDIVLFSRLQNKQMKLNSKKFDLQQLLREVKQSFDLPEYENGVNLTIDVSSNQPVFINSDSEKVWQVLSNLISNAFKYTNSGTISFGIQQKQNEWICFVKDTGIGIPQLEINHIFERFYRASNVNKGQVSGTGLGLSIVKELVELLGGKIWVESEQGKGTSFYFTLTEQ
ncbi:MAG: PAS domain S-box protein [Prolixibacteraceae bacterium]